MVIFIYQFVSKVHVFVRLVCETEWCRHSVSVCVSWIRSSATPLPAPVVGEDVWERELRGGAPASPGISAPEAHWTPGVVFEHRDKPSCWIRTATLKIDWFKLRLRFYNFDYLHTNIFQIEGYPPNIKDAFFTQFIVKLLKGKIYRLVQ